MCRRDSWLLEREEGVKASKRQSPRLSRCQHSPGRGALISALIPLPAYVYRRSLQIPHTLHLFTLRRVQLGDRGWKPVQR